MRYIIAVFALAGIVVSALALRVHYTTGTEPCDINARWDCGRVNRGSYATVDGLLWHFRAAHHPDSVTGFAPRSGFPVALVGILGYLAIALAALLRRRVFTLLLSLLGLAFALCLSNIEAHVLEAWCLYCVISQGLITLITLLALVTLFIRPRPA
jgi:vitamin-K-epoxide reductase (warfarin-sensitive)